MMRALVEAANLFERLSLFPLCSHSANCVRQNLKKTALFRQITPKTPFALNIFSAFYAKSTRALALPACIVRFVAHAHVVAASGRVNQRHVSGVRGRDAPERRSWLDHAWRYCRRELNSSPPESAK